MKSDFKWENGTFHFKNVKVECFDQLETLPRPDFQAGRFVKTAPVSGTLLVLITWHFSAEKKSWIEKLLTISTINYLHCNSPTKSIIVLEGKQARDTNESLLVIDPRSPDS